MTSEAVSLAAVRRDGRHERGERTREAIIEAYTELLAAGDRSPSAQSVALRAGVGVRTVYNQFTDLEAVRAEAGAAVYRWLKPLALRPADVPADYPLEQRLDIFLSHRLRALAVLDPFARSAVGRHGRSPALSENRKVLVALSLADLRTAFAPELRSLSPRPRTMLLHALHMASSWPAQTALREELELDESGAASAMREALRRLLTAPALPHPARRVR